MKSYEHSGEIELAHLKSNCPKSFAQCTRYELGDCRSIDLREREKKNKKPISHKPSLTWKSVIGVTSLRLFDLCFVWKNGSSRTVPLLGSSHLFWIRLTCIYFYVNLQRKKERQWYWGGLEDWVARETDRGRSVRGGAGGPLPKFIHLKAQSFNTYKVSLFLHISQSLSFSVGHLCHCLLKRRVMHRIYFSRCVHL